MISERKRKKKQNFLNIVNRLKEKYEMFLKRE